MSSFSSGAGHEDVVDVALLKSWDFSAWQARYGRGLQLPYRIDHLASHGFKLRWTDAVHSASWQGSWLSRPVSWLESHSFPLAQTALMAPAIARSAIVLAMFESEANAAALLRSPLPRHPRSSMAIISCWLAEILSTGSGARRAAYRHAYRNIDLVYCFSENQVPILVDVLGGDPARVRFVPFGIDDETFAPTMGPGGEYILVVGRDRGRDWPTTFSAVRDIGLPVKVCCRPSDIAGLDVPSNVDLVGYVERDQYRRLLGDALAVLVVTRPVLYPSGQSVLLEAMAMGKAVLVTDTPALRGYFRDGETALAAPASDAGRIRERLLELVGDDRMRARLGEAGRVAVEERFSARAMWSTIAGDLRLLAGRSGRPGRVH
jgi:glycosyltransferase involved in cell wall biosynthesis